MTNSTGQIFHDKLTVGEIDNKFPVCHETLLFISVRKSLQLVTILSHEEEYLLENRLSAFTENKVGLSNID
jgi:hypothetical protein